MKKALKRTLLTAAAMLTLLIPWDSCLGAETAGNSVIWVTSVMRSDQLSVVIRDQLEARAESRAGAESRAAAAAEQAALHLTAVNLPETKLAPGSLELSLQVSEGSCFKTAGILLEYDYSKLRPIAWDKAQTRIIIPDIAGTPMEKDLEEAWRQAAVLETKSPETISAKPALSFRNGNRAYLYLEAETLFADALETNTLAATVRFAYAQGAPPSKDYVASALNFVENRAGMKAAYVSPVKGSVLYQSEEPGSGESKFYYHKPLEQSELGIVRENENIPADKRLDGSINMFTYVESGRSVNERSAEAGDFAALTFYDWDGTLLGTRIVAKETGLLADPNLPENRPDYLNADGTAKYTDAELAAMGAAPLAPEGNVLTGEADQNGGPVTAVNKEGYRFAGWVDYNTASTPAASLSDPPGQQIDRQTLVPLSGFDADRTLRAAYHEASVGSAIKERRYEVEFSPFVSADGVLKTVFTVKRAAATRRNESGPLALAIDIRPKGRGVTRLRLPFSNRDIETVTLWMPAEASEMYQESAAITYHVEDCLGNKLTLPENISSGLIVDHRLPVR